MINHIQTRRYQCSQLLLGFTFLCLLLLFFLLLFLCLLLLFLPSSFEDLAMIGLLLQLNLLTAILLHKEVLRLPGVGSVVEEEHHPVVLDLKPLRRHVVVHQPGLPETRYLGHLVPVPVEVAHLHKQHHRLTLLADLHYLVRIAWVLDLADVKRWSGFVWMSIWQLVGRDRFLVLVPFLQQLVHIRVGHVLNIFLSPRPVLLADDTSNADKQDYILSHLAKENSVCVCVGTSGSVGRVCVSTIISRASRLW